MFFVDADDVELSNDVLDVTVPVQCLVKDSKLVIHENSKVSLMLFKIHQRSGSSFINSLFALLML